MDWYYAIDGNQAGPVSAEEFKRLAANGVIRTDTLVWREGMNDWLPYSTVMGGASTALDADAPGEWEFAGFWLRFAGAFLDGIFLNIMQFALGFVLGLAGIAGQSTNPGQLNQEELMLTGVSLLIGFVYTVFFLGSKFQATPGMMICRIRIIVADGTDCSFVRALGRYFAAYLSAIILGIGYLMCAWDSEKRTLHDMICNTRVIKK